MKLIKATIEDFHTIELTWDNPIPFTGVHVPGYTITKIAPVDDTLKVHLLEVHEELELGEVITVLWNNMEVTATYGEIIKTNEFDEKFFYDGPLGVEHKDDLTIFRVWAPTAKEVNLQLYPDENPNTPVAQIYPMTKNKKGVWALSFTGNTEGIVYDYSLIFPDGSVHISYDPYAKACIINGRRSVVLFSETMNPKFLKYQNIENDLDHDSEVLMLHCHIKTITDDKSSGLHERLRGKYLGLIEPGTTNNDGDSTGFDYITKYKPSHLRLMPIADFGSVDEKNPKNYSFGDDPININIPEGSYSSNPYEPLTRIIEAKKMIDGIHQKKIKVILDMMYSRIYNQSQHALELCVPGYFFRTRKDGKITNEIATEKNMARRYILDSVKYWFKEYRIDGICFKDIDTIDIQTMKKVREIADEVDPNIIIMGEMSETKVELEKESRSSLLNASQLFGVNFINSSLKNWLNDYPNIDIDDSQKLMNNMLGEFYNSENINMITPDQIVQEMVVSTKPKVVKNDKDWLNFVSSMYFLSQGAISLGILDSMMKAHNKDELLVINWDNYKENYEAQKYLQDLIKFRFKHPIFALEHYADIRQKQHQISLEDGVIAYSLKDKSETYTIVINTTLENKNISLPTGTYQVLINQGKIYDYPHMIDLRDEFQIAALNVTLLCRK